MKRRYILATAISLMAGAVSAPASTYNWLPTSGGPFNWTDVANWDLNPFPNAVGDIADLNANLTANVTVNLNQAITLGTLNIGDTNASNNYTIAAGTGGSLIFDNSGSHAQINIASGAGADAISAPIVLNSSLDVTNSSTSKTLTISGSMTAGAGDAVTITNLGTTGGGFFISGAISDGGLGGTVAVVENATNSVMNLGGANNFTGGTTLTAGTLRLSNAAALGGNGTFTINGGTLDTAAAAINLSSVNAQTWNGDFTFLGQASLNLGTGNVTLVAAPGGSRQVTVSANSLIVGGAISGAGIGLTKAGGGTLQLNGVNTYSGTTTINGGMLVFGTAVATIPNLSAGSIVINSNGSLAATGPVAAIESPGFNSIGGWLSSGVIATTSSGSLAINGSGSPALDFTAYPNLYLGSTNATNNYSGVLTPGASGYRLGGVGTLTVSSALNAATSLTISPVGGTVILTAANGFTGTTTVGTVGVLRISNGGALGTANSGVSDGTLVQNGGRLELDGGITVANETVTILGSGSNSDGALSNQTGNNVWAGPVILGPGTGQGGAPRIGVTNSTTASTITISGAITDAGSASPSDLGIRNGSATIGAVILSGANTYHGNTELVVGVLKLGADNTIPATSIVHMGNNAAAGSALLDLNGHNQTLAGVVPTSGNTVTTLNVVNSSATPAALTINSNAATSSSIVFGNTNQTALGGNNFSITKTGSGLLTLTAADVYTGTTNVSSSLGGGLIFSGNGSAAASAGFTVTGTAANTASLTVDNSTTYLGLGRLGNGTAPLTLQNGSYSLTGKATASNPTAETMGALTLGYGQNTISITQGAITSGPSTKLTVASLVRNNNATATVRGTSLGQGASSANIALLSVNAGVSSALVGGGGVIGGTNTNVSIIPYLTGDISASGNGTTFIGYDATNNTLRALDLTNEFKSSLASAGASDNVRLSSGSTSVAVAAATVNSLILDEASATGSVTYTLGGTVAPASGALLISRSAGSGQLFTITGGALQFSTAPNSSTSSQEGVLINNSGGAGIVNSPISGSGGITFGGTNSFTIGSTLNNWSGPTTVNSFSLKVGADGVIPDSSSVFVATTLDINGHTEAIDGLNGPGFVDTTVTGPAALTVGANNGSGSFSGTVKNTGGVLSFTKAGTGTQTLGGANTYSGGTTVSAGTLIVSGSIGASTTPTSVASGAVLGGSGILNPAVGVMGTISPGNALGSIGKLTLASTSPTAALDLSGGGIYRWELGSLKDDTTGTAGIDFDQLALTGSGGNLLLGGSSALTLGFDNGVADPNSSDPFWTSNHTWTIIAASAGVTNAGLTNFSVITNGATFADGSFATSVNSNGVVTLSFTVVPEPGSVGLAVAGTGLLLGLRRRRGAALRSK